MVQLKVDIDNILDFINYEELNEQQEKINSVCSSIYSKTGLGNEFLGWTNWPSLMDNTIIDNIISDAKKIKTKSEILVVTGIGGSYLGSRAIIDALSNNFANLSVGNGESPIVVYAGQNIGEDYLSELLEVLDTRDYSVVVISKSGTTTEPAIAFRLLKEHIEEKYGKNEAKERIFAVTDKERGALKHLADKEGYKSYVISDDIGGRYSVLTPVGLLPIAAAGFDISKLLEGAKRMEKHLASDFSINNNPAVLYAIARNTLYKKGKNIEILASYLPNLVYITEWWKQLYGESEGKDGKGIFPAGVNFTADLHSMGQYIQEGTRNIFETVLSVENSKKKVEIPYSEEDLDGLNYIAGERLQKVNHLAGVGTMMAHIEGGVPNIKISIPNLNEECLGELIYFFEMACAISGYLLGVNPFDQPGVEAYKKNMFALLGKPGFEEEGEKLRKKLNTKR